MPKKMNAQEFTQAAIAVHGSVYDYSLVEYTGFNGRVKIVCPKHGVFEQRAINHTQGKGCAVCGKASQIASSIKIDTQEYIRRAQLVHGNTYDYSQTKYVKYQAPLAITCKVHGVFEQLAHTHLQGAGCGKCGLIRRTTQKNRDKAKAFIERCRAVHPTYDFSKTVYVASKENVLVTCPIHGDFSARASGLLRGHACTNCAHADNGAGWSKSRWASKQRGRSAILYVLELTKDDELFYKVGITYDLKTRYSASKIPYAIKEILSYKSDSPNEIWDLEKHIHRTLKPIKYHPKTRFRGRAECLSQLAPILEMIPKALLA
jgi:hypothetical protein